MRFIDKAALHGTPRHLRSDTYETVRFLLAEDGLGVTVTDIMLAPDAPATYGYDAHVEIAYCIEGDAEVVEVGSGRATRVTPGVMWVAERGERFEFHATMPTRLICVFTPPFESVATGVTDAGTSTCR